MIYVWGENSYLRGFRWDGAQFQPAGQSQRPRAAGHAGESCRSRRAAAPRHRHPVGDAPARGDANQAVRPGSWRRSTPRISRVLWTSQQIAARDDCGDFASSRRPPSPTARSSSRRSPAQLCVRRLGDFGGDPCFNGVEDEGEGGVGAAAPAPVRALARCSAPARAPSSWATRFPVISAVNTRSRAWVSRSAATTARPRTSS